MEPIVFYGAGSQAYVLSEFLIGSRYRLVAIFNDYLPPRGFDVSAPVIIGKRAIDDWIAQNDVSRLSYAITIGSHHGRERWERHVRLRERGLRPVNLIHSTSFVSPSAALGDACQILAFAFVGARARLGDAVILNTKASVDHECLIGHGVHLAPGATLAGRVCVGSNTFIGTGAVVLPDVEIASNTTIGAGAVVTRNLLTPGIYVGSPARKLPKRT